MQVNILGKKIVVDGRFKVSETQLQFEKFDGTMSDEVTRLVFERGDSAAVLLYNTDTEKLLLVEQFRYPAYREGDHRSPGRMLEVLAGSIEEQESPAMCLQRETLEEIGYDVRNIEMIDVFYVSPGATSERIWLFYGEVSDADHVDPTASGVDDENIRLVELSYSDAMAHLHSYTRIKDAKTLIALYWFEQKHNRKYLYQMLDHE